MVQGPENMKQRRKIEWSNGSKSGRYDEDTKNGGEEEKAEE